MSETTSPVDAPALAAAAAATAAAGLACPGDLGLEAWWSWALNQYQGQVDSAREHLLVWGPTLRALPRWIPLEAQLAILHSSLPLQAVLRTHLPNIRSQQLAIALPWFDLGLIRMADLVVSETTRRWASGGRKALGATALPPLLPHAAPWDVLLARHAGALLQQAGRDDATELPPVAVVGLTAQLQQALVLQGWDGDSTAFGAWLRQHGRHASGWQTPEHLALWIWNERRAELPWLPRRRTWPQRQTLRAWWRGERWLDVTYEPPIELEARDGGPPAATAQGVPPRQMLTLSKAQARPYRGEPWLDELHPTPEVREVVLTDWSMRRVSALGQTEAAWQAGAGAARQPGGRLAQAVHLRIAAVRHAVPSLRKSALRARRTQRAAKSVVLWGVVLAISSPLWVSLAALLTSLVTSLR